MLRNFDRKFIGLMNKWGTDVLRICVGIVFVWFGMLKVTHNSPVEELVNSSFEFLPFAFPFIALGFVEIFIGLGLLFKVALRVTLGVMWLMLLGTFISLVTNPSLFFNGNIFLLTTEGEFVVKNLVLVAAGLVIGGREVRIK